jgi:hypothetical protein
MGLPCIIFIIAQVTKTTLKQKLTYSVLLAVCILLIVFPWFRYAYWGFNLNYFRSFGFFITIILFFIAIQGFNNFLNNRNEYFFPDPEWIFNSNYYTGNSVKLKFLRSPKGFDVKNQFGFSLQVQTNNIIKKFDFSSTQKQGPSVNYLVDLMLIGEKAKPNIGSILNISKLASQDLKEFVNNGLLFDIKRGGDYEQVNFARYSNTKGKPTIFSTIDILCSLYARTLAQNTVWHNGEKMTLYRFPSVAIDPALLEFNNMKHKTIDLIQELEIIQKFVTPNG